MPIQINLEPKTHQAFTIYAAQFSGNKAHAFLNILHRELGITTPRPEYHPKSREVIQEKYKKARDGNKLLAPPRLEEAYQILCLNNLPEILPFREQIPVHMPTHLKRDWADLVHRRGRKPAEVARDLIQEFFGEGPTRKDGLTPQVLAEFCKIYEHTGWKVLPELDTLHAVVGSAAPYLDLKILRNLYQGWVDGQV